MTNLTADQIALVDYIEAANAKTMAWVAEDSENRWAMMPVVDAEHWAEMGVYSVEQYERHMAIATHWNCYKDVYGFRPRAFDYNALSTEEILAEVEDLCKQGERDRLAEDAAYESSISAMLEMGAADRETAIRWLEQAEA
jgi:hypothetical protein